MRGRGLTTPNRTKDLERTLVTGEKVIRVLRAGNHPQEGKKTTGIGEVVETGGLRAVSTGRVAGSEITTEDVHKTGIGGTTERGKGVMVDSGIGGPGGETHPEGTLAVAVTAAGMTTATGVPHLRATDR